MRSMCVYSYTRFIHTVPYLHDTMMYQELTYSFIPRVIPSKILLNIRYLWATPDFRLLIQAVLVSVRKFRLQALYNNNNNHCCRYCCCCLLQLGCYSVAVVILHVYKTLNWLLLNWSREGFMRSMYWQLGILGTISAFAYRHRETKRTLCRGGRSQDLPNTDFWPAVRLLKLKKTAIHT